MNLRPPALFENKPGRRPAAPLIARTATRSFGVRRKRHGIYYVSNLSDAMRYARLDIETLEEDTTKTLAFDRHCFALVVAERLVKGFRIEAPNEGAAA